MGISSWTKNGKKNLSKHGLKPRSHKWGDWRIRLSKYKNFYRAPSATNKNIGEEKKKYCQLI